MHICVYVHMIVISRRTREDEPQSRTYPVDRILAFPGRCSTSNSTSDSIYYYFIVVHIYIYIYVLLLWYLHMYSAGGPLLSPAAAVQVTV